jgi:hypothetical protein
VYEPFSGSGTTIIAAETTGRACHAVELSPAYVDVAVQRWQAFTGKEATLEANGEPFTAVAAAHLGEEARGAGVEFEPSEEQRRLVRAMAGFGIRQDDIAAHLEIDPKTLRTSTSAASSTAAPSRPTPRWRSRCSTWPRRATTSRRRSSG